MDLAAGDADVALRSGDTEDGILVGRKVAISIWAIYASKGYLALHGTPSCLADVFRRPLIGFSEKLSKHRLSVWFGEVAPQATFAVRTDSVLGLVSAANSGVGIAPLPIALGDAELDLVRIFPPVPELTRAWRILCHPDQRHSRRVSALFDFVQSELDALKPILTG